MPVVVRDYVVSDEAFVLRLNDACTPEVGDMDAERFAQLRACAHRILIAEVDGAPKGFIILLRSRADYDSDNFAWFEARYDAHLYVDRIAIDASARGRGVGRAIYDATLEEAYKTGDSYITAEVNEDPPNPISMGFHKAQGFVPLESRMSGSGKVVVMFNKPVPAR